MKKYYPENYLITTPENRNILSSQASVREACHSGKIVEVRATVCDKDHNLHVDLGVMKGIIPRDEGAIGIDDGSVRDIAIISRVNKPVMCRITDFTTDEKGETIALLSRKSVQLGKSRSIAICMMKILPATAKRPSTPTALHGRVKP